jgi:chromosome segregation ATPase
MLQLKRFELGDQEVALTVKYTDREEKMKVSSEQCVEKKQLCKQSQTELNRLQKTYDKNNNELTKIAKSLVDYETEDGTIRHEIKTSFEQEKKLEKQNDQESSKVQTWENIPEEKTQEIQEAEEKLQEAEKERENREKELNKLKQDLLPQTEEWRKELTEKTNDCHRFKQDKYANKKKDYELAENRLQLLLSEEERHKNNLTEMLNDYENKQKELDTKQEKFQEIDQQVTQTEQLYQEKVDLLKNIEEEYTIVDKRFRQNQAELNNMNSQMQTTQSRDKTLNFLLGQKIQGFHQRLGSLGKRFVDRLDKYSFIDF